MERRRENRKSQLSEQVLNYLVYLAPKKCSSCLFQKKNPYCNVLPQNDLAKNWQKIPRLQLMSLSGSLWIPLTPIAFGATLVFFGSVPGHHNRRAVKVFVFVSNFVPKTTTGYTKVGAKIHSETCAFVGTVGT